MNVVHKISTGRSCQYFTPLGNLNQFTNLFADRVPTEINQRNEVVHHFTFLDLPGGTPGNYVRKHLHRQYIKIVLP